MAPRCASLAHDAVQLAQAGGYLPSHSLQVDQRLAGRIEYFPNAANLPHYGLGDKSLDDLRKPENYRYDVSFLGNLNAQRYPEHTTRTAFFRQLEPLLQQKGVRYLFADSAGMTTQQQVELIQTSKININFGAACDSSGTKSWGLPERCYGVPACGGFLLSDKREHAGKDFAPGVEWADFADLPDCVRQIHYFLEHFEQARQIAEAAHERVMREHTYRNRAVQLLKMLNVTR